MIGIARSDINDRRVLFTNTGDKTGLHPAIIEKDFWVGIGWLFDSILFVLKRTDAVDKDNDQMTKIKNNAEFIHRRCRRIIALLLLAVLCSVSLPVMAITDYSDEEYESFTGVLTAADAEAGLSIAQYGNVLFPHSQITVPDCYEYGDLILVSFLDKEVVVPFCTSWSDVESGKPGIFYRPENIALAINAGDFASTYGVAEQDASTGKWKLNSGDSDRIVFTFSMYKKGAYRQEYEIRHLSYTDSRADYQNLTDEEYANFREVRTTGIAAGRLYRTSSPIDPERNRSSYADEAIKKAGVTVVMNLCDTDVINREHGGFAGSYYSGTNYIALELGVDLTSESNKEKTAKGLKYFADNPGVYAIHCQEGKDRCGFVCAIIECLMGASLDEVLADYMVSYYNYYGVRPGDEKYDVIQESNIVKSLKRAFNVEDLAKADLSAEAAKYLMEGGMTAEDISRLKKRLGPEPSPAKEVKKANTLKAKGKTVTVRRYKLRHRASIIKRKKAISIKSACGSVTYRKISGNKRITVRKNGKIRIDKRLRKGTYKIKVLVTASGNSNYNPISKTITVKIRIR